MSRPSGHLLGLAMHSALVDRLSARMSTRLREAGIDHILLKGPSLAELLYPPSEIRTYGDCDLLVPPERWEDAIAVLRSNGFSDAMAEIAHPRMESFSSHPWESPDGDIDLHATLDGLNADMSDVWSVLCKDTEIMSIGGRDVPILSQTGRLLHVALHARSLQAQAIRDLELALERFGDADWAESAKLARQLDGVAAFSAGLRVRDDGRVLAYRLGIASVISIDTELQEGGVPLAAGLHELSEAQGGRTKLKLAAREVVPTPGFMRFWAPRLTRRGRAGLAVAYVWRPFWLIRRLPAAVRELRRARRKASDRG
jgi:hypothetical protein